MIYLVVLGFLGGEVGLASGLSLSDNLDDLPVVCQNLVSDVPIYVLFDVEYKVKFRFYSGWSFGDRFINFRVGGRSIA